MNGEEIIDPAARERACLAGEGRHHAVLPGSHAPGDAAPGSDTDIIIDIDPAAELSVYDYVGPQVYRQPVRRPSRRGRP